MCRAENVTGRLLGGIFVMELPVMKLNFISLIQRPNTTAIQWHVSQHIRKLRTHKLTLSSATHEGRGFVPRPTCNCRKGSFIMGDHGALLSSAHLVPRVLSSKRVIWWRHPYVRLGFYLLGATIGKKVRARNHCNSNFVLTSRRCYTGELLIASNFVLRFVNVFFFCLRHI